MGGISWKRYNSGLFDISHLKLKLYFFLVNIVNINFLSYHWKPTIFNQIFLLWKVQVSYYMQSNSTDLNPNIFAFVVYFMPGLWWEEKMDKCSTRLCQKLQMLLWQSFKPVSSLYKLQCRGTTVATEPFVCLNPITISWISPSEDFLFKQSWFVYSKGHHALKSRTIMVYKYCSFCKWMTTPFPNVSVHILPLCIVKLQMDHVYSHYISLF